MEPLCVIVVLWVLLRLMFVEADSCLVHPWSSRERSTSFLEKPDISGQEPDDESVFVWRRHCPVRVRQDDENPKAQTSDLHPGARYGLLKGSHSKKANHSQKKLKGSKRKRKKEKRKRFRKKKKNKQKRSTRK